MSSTTELTGIAGDESHRQRRRDDESVRNMAILKLTPSCKDYLWGGSRLRSDFGIESELNPLVEAWVLS